MTKTCDLATMELLRRIVGMRLETVAALRYPSVLAYSQVVATFAEGLSIRVDLSDEVVAPMFEVFVARVRPIEPPTELAEWDRLHLDEFVVGSVFLLRREEWIETPAKTTYQTIGQHGVEQKLRAIGCGDDERQSVIVDSGICLVSTRGAELSLDADTFPLVLQLRYEVASYPLPQGRRIDVHEHRTPG